MTGVPRVLTDRMVGSSHGLRGGNVVVPAIAFVALALYLTALATLAIDPSVTADASAANLRALVPFWGTALLLWIALSFVWIALARRDPGPTRATTLTVLAVAAVARFVVVAGHQPALSDDIHRYVLDGQTLAVGINPYRDTPAERSGAVLTGRRAAEAWPGERDLAARVNNPELHTVYLPASQWAFAAIAWPGGPPTALRFRAVYALLDLLTVAVIIVALTRRGRSAWWAALYGWHPLPLAEFAGSGHQDIIGILLLVTVLTIASGRRASTARTALWSALLAIATLVKPMTLPLAALILRRRSWQSWLVAFAAGAIVAGTLTASLLSGEQSRANLQATASRFALKWAHFGSVYPLTLKTIEKVTNPPEEAWSDTSGSKWTNDDQERLARWICLGLLVLIWLGLLVLRGGDEDGDPDADSGWRRCRILLTAMVLLSSTAHPWYAAWALALAPIAMGRTLWVLSLTLLLGYAAWVYTSVGGELRWGTDGWTAAVAYLPVYVMLAADVVRCLRRRSV